MTQKHAEIAGAGLVGLTAATALAQQGWSVRVHERGDALREIGAGITIWPNGVRALQAVGALDAATDGADIIERWELRDERNRRLQETWMLEQVDTSYAILRTTLLNALADAARRSGVEVVTGSAAIGADATGCLYLEDGKRLDADLVVGADGVGSRVREAVGLTMGVRDLKDGCGRHLIERRPQDASGSIIEQWKGGRRIGIVPCSPQYVYIYLCCPENDIAGRNQQYDLSVWKESFPAYEHYIERIPHGGQWLSFADVKVTSWSRGKVAIVGDAASAMAPNLGQAACVGMMNAVSLAGALAAELDISVALHRWQRQQQAVTDATQRYSRMYGWIGTHWPRQLLDLRSAVIWSLAHSKAMQARINVAARDQLPKS
jgi:2-polyprenyl-6-methoxyphenol hydroxylase-like FAD-dependent oxidoreductase